MKTRYLILLLLLTGCASTPPDSPWDGLTTETGPATPALDCGRFPAPLDSVMGIAITEITYDQAGVNALESYRLCAEANEGNVDEHAAQILQLKVARAALVEAGQAQRNIAIMRQQMLEDERRHHLWQSLGYWVLIIGAIAL